MDNLEQLQNRITEAKKLYQASLATILSEICSTTFARYPEIQTIYWKQYTPSFNDGDPCEFTLGELEFSPQQHSKIHGPYDDFDDGEDEEQAADSLSPFGLYNDCRVSKEMKEDLQSFRRLLRQLEHVLEDAYGNGAFVKMWRDGFEVTDYDCGY